MKLKVILSALLSLPLFASCIQDEPLNPEADILEFSLPQGMALSETVFNQGNITIMVNKNADLTKIRPYIKITPGATITPDTTLAQNFTDPVTYTVRSQDGKNQRTYIAQLVSTSLNQYRFEKWEETFTKEKNNRYETPTEVDIDGTVQRPWASSNQGVNIYFENKGINDFPLHSTTQAYEGNNAAEMETKVGPGKILPGIDPIPIVAGSLFTGSLNPLNALKDPLTATKFGQPCFEKPQRFTGNYIYKAGTGNYINKDGQTIVNIKDSCAVYSVFYVAGEKGSSKPLTLDGTNILTHESIVAIAMMPGEDRAGSKGTGYQAFDIPFEYKVGKIVDFEKYDYKLAIVFSSSFYGDHYEGTPGSKLIVDNIEIISAENNENK